MRDNSIYRHTSNIRRKFVRNKVADHSDVVGPSPVGAANYIFILTLTPGFNGLDKSNCKTRREVFKLWNLVRVILETLRYINQNIYLQLIDISPK